MTTLQDLYEERCKEKNGKLIPHYWQPQKIQRAPFCIFGDTGRPVSQSMTETLYRILALQAVLEIPVGEWVKKARQEGNLPDEPFIYELLQSNSADEASHDLAVRYAVNAYAEVNKYLPQAEVLAKEWQEVALDYHPLFAPCVLEIGVFLVVLGVMRVFGGPLSDMAAKIAVDEARHTASNRGILELLGHDTYDPPKPLRTLIYLTLTWLFEEMEPVRVNGFFFDLANLIGVSDQLIEGSNAPDYDKACYAAEYDLPFENSNASQYDRVEVVAE